MSAEKPLRAPDPGGSGSSGADGPDPTFGRDCTRFFAARLKGPADARAAVLAALAAGEPYVLARRASEAAPPLGIPGSHARRVGLMAEVLRAVLRVCTDACRGRPLSSRLERARRVLVADTLLTFLYELAGDLPDPQRAAVCRILPGAIGASGFLGSLADGASDLPSPDRTAGAFLEAALDRLSASGRSHDP